MNDEINKDDLARAAANLVLRELDEMEARDIFGGDGASTPWGKVTVGPLTPIKPAAN